MYNIKSINYSEKANTIAILRNTVALSKIDKKARIFKKARIQAIVTMSDRNTAPRFITVKDTKELQKQLDAIMLPKNKHYIFNSYGDPVIDELFKATTICLNTQRRKDPERAGFYGTIMAEYFKANARFELPAMPFLNDAILYYYEHIGDVDTKDVNAINKLYFKSANNAIYQYKYKGDGVRKTINADISDIEKTRTANSIINVQIHLNPIQNKAQKDFINDLLDTLPKKQYVAMFHYYINCANFSTLEDIFNNGYNAENVNIKEQFKDYSAFKLAYCRAKKALKEQFSNDKKVLEILSTICD